MSEALEGVPPAPPAPLPRPAAAVMLFRRAGEGVELFWLKREKTLRFAGGFYAFPGGKLDGADAQVPVAGARGQEAALVAAAARELFEETGALKARGPLPGQDVLDDLRAHLLVERVGFGELLARHGLHLDAADFPLAGRWVTPPFLPVRFDARFYLVEAPEGQRVSVWPGELELGEWTTPRRALARWEDGTVLLHPPLVHALQVFERFVDPAGVLAALRTAPFVDQDFISHHIEFQRGVLLLPLRSPTLPPATHTNAYVLGTGECLIVDPGSHDEAENERLIAHVRALGYRPLAVVLTHQHQDHVGGARQVSQAFGVPVWAHRLAAQQLPFEVARFLEEGDVLALDGPFPMRWRVLHTPGHARGHVCLVNEATRLGVVGDMVAGVGTIVIDPPEGDMAEYLRQLERLKGHLATLCPAHGPMSPDAVARLDEYLVHRAWREERVLEAVASFDGAAIGAVVEKAYDDVLAFVWPIAERNTLAILLKLEAEGRVVREAGVWRAVLRSQEQ